MTHQPTVFIEPAKSCGHEAGLKCNCEGELRGIRYMYGDAVKYTGLCKVQSGATCYQIRFMDGHRKGQLWNTFHGPAMTQAEYAVLMRGEHPRTA